MNKFIIPDGCKKFPKIHPDRSKLSIFEWEKQNKEELIDLFNIFELNFKKKIIDYNSFVIFCYKNSSHDKLNN